MVSYDTWRRVFLLFVSLDTLIDSNHFPIALFFFFSSECAKKSNVEEKRAAAIRGFYKKWSPENVDKADALAKKADSNGKMAALFRKLVTKYPKSIKVEVSLRLSKFFLNRFLFVLLKSNYLHVLMFPCRLKFIYSLILVFASSTTHMCLLAAIPPFTAAIVKKVDDEMKMYQDMMNKAKEEKGDDDADGSDEHDEF